MDERMDVLTNTAWLTSPSKKWQLTQSKALASERSRSSASHTLDMQDDGSNDEHQKSKSKASEEIDRLIKPSASTLEEVVLICARRACQRVVMRACMSEPRNPLAELFGDFIYNAILLIAHDSCSTYFTALFSCCVTRHATTATWLGSCLQMLPHLGQKCLPRF